jgi:hypothetical protein
MADSRNNWWAVLWPGLVLDEDGKHVRRLRLAVWLLLYLIVAADRRTGVVLSYRTTIARRMGVPLRTVQRWLLLLERKGYVSFSSGRRGARIRLLRWRPLVPRAGSDVSDVRSGVIRARSDAKDSRHVTGNPHSRAKKSRSDRSRTK